MVSAFSRDQGKRDRSNAAMKAYELKLEQDERTREIKKFVADNLFNATRVINKLIENGSTDPKKDILVMYWTDKSVYRLTHYKKVADEAESIRIDVSTFLQEVQNLRAKYSLYTLEVKYEDSAKLHPNKIVVRKN